MATKRCYYEVLQVEKTVGPDVLKRSYRKLALKFHPDNYKGDKTEGETKFKELAEAYEVLSDPQKRQQYDQYGHDGLNGSGMHDFSSMGFGDIFSMFNDIFGGGGGFGGARSAHQERGLDLETEVSLTLEEVAIGSEQTLEFERMDYCETCGGSGAKPGTQPERCSACGGYGQVQQQVSGFFGMSIRVVPCQECAGKGKIVKDPCNDCSGTGRTKTRRVLSVSIPAGIRNGQVVRVRNEGEPANNGPHRGDLHVYVNVEEHSLLIRKGDDLVCQVPVPFTTAALGGKIQVPTLDGLKDIEIAAGSQNGHVISMRKKGLPAIGSSYKGDLHVQVLVEVPKKVSAEQRELLEKLAELDHKNVTPKRKSFLDKLKDCFKELKK